VRKEKIEVEERGREGAMEERDRRKVFLNEGKAKGNLK